MNQWLCGAEMEAHSAGVTVRRYPTIEPLELTQDRGNRLLEGTEKIFCAPGRRRKEQWPHKRLAQECPGVSSWGVSQWWPAAGSGVLSAAVPAWDLLKEVAIIFITSTIVWPQVNNKEGTQPHPSTENWIKDLLNMAPPTSKSLPSGSFQKPLILSEGRQTENHNHRNLTNLVTWNRALFNLMKL